LEKNLMEQLLNELAQISGAVQPVERVDGWWMVAPDLDVQAAARLMLKNQARLSTMTAVALPSGETDLIYHYVAPKLAINLKVTTRQNRQPSITPILPAADWIEREIHDLYLVDFKGHPNLARLVLPVEIPQGLYRQPGGAASKTERKE
jgi:NADH:ubiquinone oxidoreductase subunit C